MNKTLKSVICICLCAVLMFGIFTAPIVQPKAEAFAITATAGMIAIGVTLLTMLGITFASVGAAEQASKGLVEGSKDIFDWVNDLSLQGGEPGGEPGSSKWFKLGATTTAGLATFVNKARALFGNGGDSGDVDVVVPDAGFLNNIKYTTKSVFSGSEDVYNFTDYSCFEYNSSANGLYTSINGVDYCYYFYHTGTAYKLLFKPDPVTGNWTYPYYNSSTREYLELNTHDLYCFSSLVDCRLGFRYKDSVSGDYIEPFIAYKWINTSGIISYGSIVGNIQLGNVPIGAVELSPVYTPVPYVGTSPYPISDIYNALAEKLKTQEITFDYTDTLDQIENHTDEQLQVSQDQLLEQAQIKDLLEQIKAGQGDTTKTELQEKDLTIPETPHNLTWKFPFCVPFDLIALVGALNATPKDPKWEIPFHVESLGFNDEIELDLTKFEPVTNVLRVVTTIMFLLGLIIVTRKMIKG